MLPGIVDKDYFFKERTSFCKSLQTYLNVNRDLSVSENRVMRQTVEALLFEKVVPFEMKEMEVEPIGWSGHSKIYDREFYFVLGDQKFKSLGTVRAFDRVRVAPGSVSVWRDKGYVEAKLEDLILAIPASEKIQKKL